MHRSPVTQTDLARSLGVTPRTISTAFGASGRISAATQRRVLEAAEKYGYRPNAAARAQRSKRFSQIAMLVRHDLAGFLQNDLNKGAFAACQSLDLHLVYAESEFNRFVKPGEAPKVLRELCVDGMLVHYAWDIPDQSIHALRSAGVPIVWVNTRHTENCVYPDDAGGAAKSVQELIRLGHRRIGYLHQANDTRRVHYSEAERLNGYQDAIKDASLTPYTCNVPPPEVATDLQSRVNQYVVALREHSNVSAWLCANQRVANQLLFAALSLGKRVPKDLSVLAFGDAGNRFITGIPLSVIKVPMRKVGEAAVKMLSSKIIGYDKVCPSIAIPYSDFDMNSVSPTAGCR
ncbi:MAG: LacI family DNA-binding transcriptional regulator [Planctomycetota bacterium]